MFVPLHDKNPLNHVRFQYVTIALIVTNVIVFVMTNLAMPTAAANNVAFSYGVIPAVLFEVRQLPAQLAVLPEELTLVSYMFLHAGWMHLLGNMAFLWVFGDNVEDAMGHVRFLIFYLACGIFAGLLHSYMQPNSDMPLVGASGAVAGVIAAYLMLHPRVKVWVLVLWRIPLRIPALWALGVLGGVAGFQPFGGRRQRKYRLVGAYWRASRWGYIDSYIAPQRGCAV